MALAAGVASLVGVFRSSTAAISPPNLSQRLSLQSSPNPPLLRSSGLRSVSHVACGRPSMAVAAGNYNVQVVVGEGEPDEEVVRKFRGAVLRAGIIQECKRRRFFEDKQAEKKRRTRDAAKRNKRRRSWSRKPPTGGKRQEEPVKDAEEEDNWELPPV
ncbi:uncharacterized protein LOC144706072 isoform X2 [Wolffia australiana]